MPSIQYQDTSVHIEAPETLLEGLEQAGFQIPFSCRSGVCHSCMMQAHTQPPVTAQHGLSENQKAQHYFLACSCIPSDDMQVSLIGDTTKLQGYVVKKQLLNDSVLALFIKAECHWFPGQYLSLWYNDNQGRPYSIASRCDEQKIIELHIKRHNQGLVSRWLHDDLDIGQQVTISAPIGNCFYSEGHKDKPILMAGTGTGLAPLYGIVQEAMAQGHTKDIYVYAAAGDPSGLYYVDKLKALADTADNLHYIPVVRRHGENQQYIVQADVVDLIQERHPDCHGWKIFLCGSTDMIKKVQRHCFFQGANATDILVDVFEKSV